MKKYGALKHPKWNTSYRIFVNGKEVGKGIYLGWRRKLNVRREEFAPWFYVVAYKTEKGNIESIIFKEFTKRQDILSVKNVRENPLTKPINVLSYLEERLKRAGI